MPDWIDLLYNGAPVVIGIMITMFWGRIEKVLKALKELSDVLKAITDGLADANLTKEELDIIRKEGVEAMAAFKAILK